MRRLVVFLTILVACAVAGLVLLTSKPGIKGVPAPVSPPLLTDEVKRAVLSLCQAGAAVDLMKLRLGPAVPYGDEYIVFAAAADGTMHSCTSHGLSGSIGGPPPTPEVKVSQFGNVARGSIVYAGFGLVAPEVARVQVKESEDVFREAQIVNGMYAYSGPGSNPSPRVDLRAYDINGTLIYRT